MTDTLTPDICVIGGGAGGLVVAAGASQMGADVVLLEDGKMGGDCLNYGCVPSKALIAAGHAAHNVRNAGRFGIGAELSGIDFEKAHDHVHGVIDGIAVHDSVERFRGLGVNVITETGRFVDPRTVEAGTTTIKARRFVIATGSSAAVPPIDGLADTPFLTNETIFEKKACPEHLIVIGGGPIGMEMAQAHRRLGARVTVLDAASVMPKDDPELVDVVRLTLMREGVTIREGISVKRVAKSANGVSVTIVADDAEETVEGSDLLVAAGRRPNLSKLNLDAAGIKHDRRGIETDLGLKTSNRKVYAIGDAAGRYQFTHIAGYHATVVIKNALFRLPARINEAAVPWVTYTSPELANIGLNEPMAREKYGSDIRVLRFPFAENDRANAERETNGLVKVITTPKGKVLGAGMVGEMAGELIQSWMLPVAKKMHIKEMAGVIAPYPTRGEVNKRAAGAYYTPQLFSERTRKVVRFLSRFG